MSTSIYKKPLGLTFKRQSCTKNFISIAMAMPQKFFAQSYLLNVNYELCIVYKGTLKIYQNED